MYTLNIKADKDGNITVTFKPDKTGKVSSTGKTNQFFYEAERVKFNGKIATLRVQLYSKIDADELVEL